jgi:uncharacterized RDD family membrane protein YckC
MRSLQLTTDHNVPIDVELASVGQRVVAVLLDVIIMVAYVVIMSLIMSAIFISSFRLENFGEMEVWKILFMIIVYLPFVLYTPLLEYLTKGQTIGKMAMGIRVTKLNGENAKFKEYFTRWLFRPLEFYILLFASGGILLLLASAFFDILIASVSGSNQRIGDFMANTVVVRKNPNRAFSIQDVLAIKSNKNYDPTYRNVTMYTDEDMMLVKNTITRVEKYRNENTKKLAISLAEKIANDLQLPEVPEKRLKFLKTVLNDYVVLTR